MKITNYENGVKKIYVQMEDINMLLNYSSNCTSNIMKLGLSDSFKKDSLNKSKFIAFSDPEDVSFLESIDWIVDFRSVFKTTEIEVVRYNDFLSNQVHELEIRRDKAKGVEASKIDNDIILSNYKLHSLSNILMFKRGLVSIPFPIVPDYTKEYIDVEDEYKAVQGLNPLQMLIYKKNGSLFLNGDSLWVQSFVDIYGTCLDDNIANNEFFWFNGTDWSVGPDRKCYVITLLPRRVEYKEKPVSIVDRIKDRIQKLRNAK